LGNEAALMVITKPSFGEDWEKTQGPPDLFYHETKEKDVGILFNKAFSDKYSIHEDPHLFGPKGDVSFFKITDKSGTDIHFSNFHGNKPNLVKFIDWVDQCKNKGINYITGDSGVSYKEYYKGDTPLRTDGKKDILRSVLQTILKNGEIMRLSTIPMNMKKQELDIVWNNDIENTTRYVGIDGRFVIDLNNLPSNPLTEDSNVIPTNIKPVALFSPNTIADQNVVQLKTKEFNLLSATSFLIGREEEWGEVSTELMKKDIFEDYHKQKGRDYTMIWLQLYNDWIKDFNLLNPSNQLKAYELNPCELKKSKNGTKASYQPDGCILSPDDKKYYEDNYKYTPPKSKSKSSSLKNLARGVSRFTQGFTQRFINPKKPSNNILRTNETNFRTNKSNNTNNKSMSTNEFTKNFKNKNKYGYILGGRKRTKRKRTTRRRV